MADALVQQLLELQSMTDETVFDGFITLSKDTGSTDGYISALRARIRELEARVNYQSELLLGLDRIQLLRIEKLEAALREVSGTSKYVVASEMRNLALRALSSVEDK